MEASLGGAYRQVERRPASHKAHHLAGEASDRILPALLSRFGRCPRFPQKRGGGWVSAYRKIGVRRVVITRRAISRDEIAARKGRERLVHILLVPEFLS